MSQAQPHTAADIRRLAACTLLGFASGLPFYVQVTLIPAWLRSHGVALTVISMLAWTRVPYVWKFLWAPLVDRIQLPFASRRRDWMLLTQALIITLLIAFGVLNPTQSPTQLAVLTALLALSSATQDVAIDAYRREILSDAQLGLGNALSVNAYRIAGAVSGGLALVLADHFSWQSVYFYMAAAMSVGLFGVWLAPEVPSAAPTLRGLRGYLEPLAQLFRQHAHAAGSSKRRAIEWLGFLVTYKFGDCLATSLLTPFYLDRGYSLTQIGSTVKAVSLTALVLGSLLAGYVMTRVRLRTALFTFGCLQALAIGALFSLSIMPPNLGLLIAAVGLEYLGMSLASTAFVAYLARCTAREFSGTQYAALSSFVSLPQLAASTSAGWLIGQLGYPVFFLGCIALSLPGLWLALRVAPRD